MIVHSMGSHIVPQNKTDNKTMCIWKQGLKENTVFSRVICALLFSTLAAEKSRCLKMRIFFVEVLIWVLFWYNREYGTFYEYFIVIL
jgi:hypothetical protein